ncbi:MAG TPA: tetratricopeptide repeat protein, partial [Chthoniobacterales bacterium]
QWPLGAAMLALTASFLIRERKRVRAGSASRIEPKRALATATALVLLAATSLAAGPGLDAYRNENYSEAYQEFEKTLKEHPNSHAADKIQFDAGAAAYKLGDYNKALEWFSRSLLSKDKTLQQKSHYNIGRTLEERADKADSNEKALGDLSNAQSHYEEALKLDPRDDRAKANLEEVKKKIERLKQNPKRSPTPPPQSQKEKKQQQPKDQQQKDQQKKDEEKKDQDQQQQDQSAGRDQQEDKKQEQKPGETPSPSPSENPQQNQPGSSPSPSADQGSGGDKKDEQQPPSQGEQDASPSPSPSGGGNQSPSPSPGDGEESQPDGSPSPSPGSSPDKKLSGEVKGAGEDKPNEPPQIAEAVQAEPEKEGQMSEKQAQQLLQSMKDEERRVQLDERKAPRRVYKDW